MIVAGFGFSTAATEDSLASALAATGHGGPIDALATAETKVAHRALRALAETHALPLAAVDPERLRAADTRTQAVRSKEAHDTGSVAEAAALVAAGPGARLLGARAISDDRLATCAIAERSRP